MCIHILLFLLVGEIASAAHTLAAFTMSWAALLTLPVKYTHCRRHLLQDVHKLLLSVWQAGEGFVACLLKGLCMAVG